MFQRRLIERRDQDGRLLFCRKAACQVDTKFSFEQWDAFLSAAPVPERVFNGLGYGAAVVKCERERVGNRALLRIVIIGGKRRLGDALHLFPQGIDAWIGGEGVFVIGGGEMAEDE